MHALIAGSGLPRTRACTALDGARATGYRRLRPAAARAGVCKASHRRLPEAQRMAILAHLHSPRFCDQTPAHTYHTLLAEGTFLCSIRTMQRLLKDAGEARERRPIRPPQTHALPQSTQVKLNMTSSSFSASSVDAGTRFIANVKYGFPDESPITVIAMLFAAAFGKTRGIRFCISFSSGLKYIQRATNGR